MELSTIVDFELNETTIAIRIETNMMIRMIFFKLIYSCDSPSAPKVKLKIPLNSEQTYMKIDDLCRPSRHPLAERCNRDEGYIQKKNPIDLLVMKKMA